MADKLEKLLIHRELKVVPITDLKPNSYNPNKMDEEVMASLVHGMKTEGVVQPVLIQKSTNIIIDGEHRWWAVQKAGGKEISVLALDIDDVAAKKLTLAMNYRKGEHQVEALDKVLTDLLAHSGDLNPLELGMSKEMLDNHLATSSSFLDDMAMGDTTMPDLTGSEEPLPGMGGSDYSKLQYLATPDQKKFIIGAINKAKNELTIQNSTEALVHISRQYLGDAVV